MTNSTLTITTEDGRQYVADVEDFDVDYECVDCGDRKAISRADYCFEVGTLVNVEDETEMM